MASLWVTQCADLTLDTTGDKIQAAVWGASETLTISGTAADSVATFTRPLLRLFTDTNCHVKLGTTATTSDIPMQAGVVEYVALDKPTRISVIARA